MLKSIGQVQVVKVRGLGLLESLLTDITGHDLLFAASAHILRLNRDAKILLVLGGSCCRDLT